MGAAALTGLPDLRNPTGLKFTTGREEFFFISQPVRDEVVVRVCPLVGVPTTTLPKLSK
jgi:hypothetical protein